MGVGRRVVILAQLRLRRSLAQLLGLPAGRRREEPHLALELDQLLIGVRLHFQGLELLYEGIAREVLVHLGRRDQLALLVLDLLGHALERRERALVADRGHGFLDALVRLGALLPRDQDVLLALRLLDPIVQLAERQLELLGFLAMLHPRLVQLHETWVKHREETEKLKLSLRQLNDRIEEAKRKKNILIARQKRAEAHKRIQETMSSIGDKSAFATFERMTEQIEHEERKLIAAAEVHEDLSGDTLLKQFQSIEVKADADQQQLDLKRKLGLLPAGSPAEAKRLGKGAAEAELVEDDDTEHHR